ncbi:MAG: hypothetical protein F6K24_30880 [Okeania sp. SIO2D1]|nr:hypothetical protein [Okeania sp. SIO2D1]
MNEAIKAKRAVVRFCDGIEVEGYLLPNGEYRVGKASIASALGYSKDWVRRVISGVASGRSKETKTLKGWGFSGVASTVKVPSPTNAKFVPTDTLSLKDFRILIRLADKRGKKEASALIDALLDVGLEDWFRLAFGQEQLTLEEKREKFYKTYSATISFEDWLSMDREDKKLIQEQLKFLEVTIVC